MCIRVKRILFFILETNDFMTNGATVPKSIRKVFFCMVKDNLPSGVQILTSEMSRKVEERGVKSSENFFQDPMEQCTLY